MTIDCGAVRRAEVPPWVVFGSARGPRPSGGRGQSLLEGRAGTQCECDGVANDKPVRKLLQVSGGHGLVDPGLKEGAHRIAMLRDQLAGDHEGPGILVPIHGEENSIAWPLAPCPRPEINPEPVLVDWALLPAMRAAGLDWTVCENRTMPREIEAVTSEADVPSVHIARKETGG